MAGDLRGRIQDLHHLNRGIQEMTSSLDLEQTINSVIGFCTRHSSADRVRVLLREPDRDRVEIHGGSARLLDRQAPDVTVLLEAVGPISIRLTGATALETDIKRALPERFADFGSLLAFAVASGWSQPRGHPVAVRVARAEPGAPGVPDDHDGADHGGGGERAAVPTRSGGSGYRRVRT